MEKLVSELRKIVTFKDTTDVGDIVLIVAKEPQMLVYAKVTDIQRDPSRKDEWWHVSLSVLSIPLQEMVWTLRTAQLTGMEIFTMAGEDRFVKAIVFPEKNSPPARQEEPAVKPTGKITPFRRVK